jgi:hypothetical protein
MESKDSRKWIRLWIVLGVPILLCPMGSLVVMYLGVLAQKGFESDFALVMIFLAGLMLLPVLALEGILGGILYVIARGRRLDAEWRAAIDAKTDFDVALPLSVKVEYLDPLPEVMSTWGTKPEKLNLASFVQSVEVTDGELTLEGAPRGRDMAPLARLSGGILGHGLAAILESLPLLVPTANIAKVQVAVGKAKPVIHMFFRRAPNEPIQVYSFALASPSDFCRFWAALRKQFPWDKLVLPERRSAKTAVNDEKEKGDGVSACVYCGAQLHDEIVYCMKCGKSKPPCKQGASQPK